jgi:hypothetical protein
MKLTSLAIGTMIVLLLGPVNKRHPRTNKTCHQHLEEYQQVPHAADTLTWIEDFKLFRTAIYQNDIAKVKTYFKFPVLNPNNEIWYLILPEDQLSKGKFSGSKIIPFNEKDLVQHYNNIFPKKFVKSILKIKTDELYKKGYVETAEQGDSTATYVMYVTYDKQAGLLSLNLAYNNIIRNEEDGSSDVEESNVIYYFTVQKNGKLFFKEIRLAG